VMPGISGVDLAIQFKAECPACQILLFSGQANTQDLLKDARSQGNNFQLLQKPVQPSVMLLNVAALTGGSGRVSIPALPVNSSPRVVPMPSTRAL
jgi:CheY-like chemotaxis protein